MITLAMTAGIAYRDRVQLSPSKLDAWTTCPRRFWHSAIARTPGRPWAHFGLGNAVHRALKDWWDVPHAVRDPDQARALVRKHWRSAGFADAQQAERWRLRAEDMVCTYLERLDPAWEPVGRERRLGARFDGVSVNGQIDRLDEDPQDAEALIVVDYKTGSSVPSVEQVRSSMPLAIYALMVQRTLKRRCLRVELHHLPSGQVACWEHSAHTLDRHRQRIDDLAHEIIDAVTRWRNSAQDDADRDALFPATASALCGYCDAWSLCPTGQAATAQRAPWDGLAESPADAPSARGLEPTD